jgi:flagellar hook-associated protein FlgK
MKIKFIIFALSMFLISCQEETIRKFQCGGMFVSDALPVQFWLSDCETYNEYEADGVHHVCWCQPFNCDDEILIQFQHTAGQSLELVGRDSDGATVFSTGITEISTGVYQLTFIPSDYDVCDKQIQLLIMDTDDADIETITDASTWTTVGGAWDYRDNNKLKFGTENGTRSASMGFNNFLTAGTVVSFYLTIDTNAIDGAVEILVSLVNGADYKDTQTINITPANIGVQTILITLEVPPLLDASALRIDITDTGSTSVDIDLYFGVETATEVMTPPILVVGDVAVLAKSDCLDIKTAHTGTKLFEYSNQRNFAGLIYENDSPDTTFAIRVPCRFFHETEPEEDEGMELTSSIITTSAQVKTQRLLEVKQAPYYFHKKLRRVLKHQSVTSDNIAWKKEEQYQIIESRKNWPLKSATCLLTEKNSPARNVL